MDLFKNNIKELLDIESKSNELKKELNNLKSKKDDIENDILNYINENNIKNKDIYINNKKISCANSKSYESISKKFVLQRLIEFLNDDDQANKIANYIFNSRNINEKEYLKITEKK